jgi:hypothetical protein
MAMTSVQDPPSVVAPGLDRAQWQSHPHFPGQTLLLGSHDNFRRVSSYLVEVAAAGEAARSIGGTYRRWIAAMRAHEAYEEGKLYPFLERRWGASFAAAERGHRALHDAHDQVMSALAAGDPSFDTLADGTLHRALERHDRVLRDHLSLEEALVIPLLLALSPDEFSEYYNLPLQVLLDRLETRAFNTEE